MAEQMSTDQQPNSKEPLSEEQPSSSSPTSSSGPSTAQHMSSTQPTTLKRKSESLAQLLEAYTDCSDEDVVTSEDDEADSSSSSSSDTDGGAQEDDDETNDIDGDDEDIEVEEGEEVPNSTDDENESSSSEDDKDTPETEKTSKDILATRPDREKLTPPADDAPTESTDQKKKSHAAKSLAADLGLDILPAVDNLNISVQENECMPVGQVHSIVDRLVVVESIEKTPALSFDTILFDSSGRAIGQVFDIFGQVKRPYYTIRFNSRDEIDKTGLTVGSLTYCAPKTEYTKYVFTQQLLREKGSDASWKHDQEVPDKYKDYSDDEEERRAKRGGKAKTKEPTMEEEPESPSRKKHLSFERQMNWNNTYRNRVCKRRTDEERMQKTNWDVGWHNYRFPMPPPMRPVGYGRGGTSSQTLKPETGLSQPLPVPPPPMVPQPTQSHLPDYAAAAAAAAGFPPSMSHPPPQVVAGTNWYCRPCDQPPPPPPPSTSGRPYQQHQVPPGGHHFMHHHHHHHPHGAVPPPPAFPFPPPPPPPPTVAVTTSTCPPPPPVGVYPTALSTAPPPSYSQVMSSSSPAANPGVFLARYPPPPPGHPQQRLYYNPYM